MHRYDMIITLTPGHSAEVTRRSERGFEVESHDTAKLVAKLIVS